MKTTIESYQQQKTRHAKELNHFEGLFWAFNNEQFDKGIKKLNLAEGEKVVSIGAGGYVAKSRVDSFLELMKRHKAEREELRRNEKEIIKALAYELWNHEYCISGDPQDALNALGIDEIDPKILKKAITLHNKQK